MKWLEKQAEITSSLLLFFTAEEVGRNGPALMGPESMPVWFFFSSDGEGTSICKQLAIVQPVRRQ